MNLLGVLYQPFHTVSPIRNYSFAINPVVLWMKFEIVHKRDLHNCC